MSAKPLISVAEAESAVLAQAHVLPATSVPLVEAVGRVLATDLAARWDLPNADVSIMDGWAVRAADLRPGGRENFVDLLAMGESAAGHPSALEIEPGRALRISTGAVLPEGADAVVPREDVSVEGVRVRIDLRGYGEVSPGRFVRARGSDLARGERVLAAGTYLRPGGIAALASCGHDRVQVHAKPRVAIVGTGDELVSLGKAPARGQVVSANGFMLAALVREAGGIVVECRDVKDDETHLTSALRDGLFADVLVTSGGISVGDHDLVHKVLEGLGARTIFRGVALQPGKPTTFLQTAGCLVFALPGNPASSLVAFELLVRPALRKLAGRTDLQRRVVDVRLLAPASGNMAREHYVRAQRRGGDGAMPLTSQLSGNLRSIADFDLLLRIPAGARDLAAGERCEALDLSTSP